jgi:hypothetical protein
MENPDFTKWIEDAAQIRTSGRWTAVNAKIERMADNTGAGNEWYVQILSSLVFQLLSEYSRLTRTYEENRGTDISVLAWQARNLMELWVWCLYCTKSIENARRLYEDAGRDMLSMVSAYTKSVDGKAELTGVIEQMKLAEEDLRGRAVSEGIENLDGSYKRVDDAAKECGVGNYYSLFFKMASKFAHPTAMLMLTPLDKLKDSGLRDFFFSEGCLCFSEAFRCLENHLPPDS